jgi:O-6-methylguanine DNA methyltransferase
MLAILFYYGNNMTSFSAKVYQVVKTIPQGSTMTYGEVALAAGHPGAARAVGTILSKNYDDSIPCHRVICSDGKLGNYNRGGIVQKALILRTEGAI